MISIHIYDFLEILQEIFVNVIKRLGRIDHAKILKYYNSQKYYKGIISALKAINLMFIQVFIGSGCWVVALV